MMALVKVTWEDQNETVYTAPARIEDTSPSGACFRLRVPIRPGTRVEVSSCRDEFSGMTKWCREDDGEYLVGMQRDRTTSKALTRVLPSVQPPSVRQVDIPPVRRADTTRVRPLARPIVREVERPNVHEMGPEEQEEMQEMDTRRHPLSMAPVMQSYRPAHRRVIRRGTLIPIPKPKPLPLTRITFPPAVIQKPVIGYEIALDYPRDEATTDESADSSAQYQNRTTSFFEERTEMPNKWLNLGSRGQQKEGSNGGGGIGAGHMSPGMAGDTTFAPPRGDLLLLEDIYRTAGIMEPRMGYSITKVVEMLSNDHLRGLGDEVKRASVLMALNAAGIPLGDILQDAAQRQAAVAAYEVEQRKKFEEYWTRRAEENSALQTEMERVTRQYVERMNRNLTEVQQEKEAFQKWQTAMQHEVLRISEAVTLCAQPAVYESSSEQSAAGGSESLVAKSA
jgi:hypothetical protein